jgi:branched-chain amino acid transport system substrate-binding protein
MKTHVSTNKRVAGSTRLVIVLVLSVLAVVAAFLLLRPPKPQTGNQPLVVGVINPTTGPFAAYGGPVRDGILLAVDEFNAAEGIGGRKIALVMEDDGGNPKNSVNAFTKLATVSKVPVVIGPLSSGASMATAPLAEQYKTVQVSTLAGTIDLTKAGDFVFRIYPSSEVGSRFIAKQAVERFKAKRIAIFYPNNAFGVASRKFTTEVVKNSGAEVVAEETFTDGDRDFRTQLIKISQARPDVILCSAYYEEGAQILVQAKELGINVPVLGEDGWFGPIAAIARDALPNLYFANIAFGPEYTDNAVMQRFIAAFEKRYGRKPNSGAATGYAAIQVVCHAITTGGADAVNIKEALYKTDIPTVMGQVRYDANGDNVGATYGLFQLNSKDEPILVK